MNNFLGNELAHKVKCLSCALENANSIISKLEEENQALEHMFRAFFANEPITLDTLPNTRHSSLSGFTH